MSGPPKLLERDAELAQIDRPMAAPSSVRDVMSSLLYALPKWSLTVLVVMKSA